MPLWLRISGINNRLFDCYFSTQEGFCKASDTSCLVKTNVKMDNVEMAVYEISMEINKIWDFEWNLTNP